MVKDYAVDEELVVPKVEMKLTNDYFWEMRPIFLVLAIIFTLLSILMVLW